MLLGDSKPDTFGRTYGLRKLGSREIPSPYKERYPYYFTKTDMRIAVLLCTGLRTKAIASELFISEATAYRHIHNIFEKLGINSRQELIAAAFGELRED